MPAELTLVKRQDGLMEAATQADFDTLSNWRPGRGYKVNAVRLSDRALGYHRRYWAGLIALTLDYWQPTGGLIGSSEKAVLTSVIRYAELQGAETSGLKTFFNAYLSNLKTKRASTVEVPHKSKEALHEWIKEEAGLFDLVMTPKGAKRVTKSINFNSMSDEEFREFYKKAFTVCWNFVLSKTFDDPEEAEHAAHQLIALG
ncbi:DUF1367 family protein [Parasphingorhabdus sp.]|uniref:DUF1367 family protein n=1 Tax=Parasphingorhabdus sp. TaxID=2709688 RepID=UPI003A9229E5